MLIQLRSEEDHKNIVEQGFTLVELLIVIVILGILAGIVVFAVGNLTGTANKNACATESSTFYTGYNTFKASQGKAPGGAVPTAATVMSDLTGSTQGGPYLQTTPKLVSAGGYYDITNSTTANYNGGSVATGTWAFDPASGATTNPTKC